MNDNNRRNKKKFITKNCDKLNRKRRKMMDQSIHTNYYTEYLFDATSDIPIFADPVPSGTDVYQNLFGRILTESTVDEHMLILRSVRRDYPVKRFRGK
jgi:hypothetical protein